MRRPDRGVWAGLWSLPEFSDLSAAQTTVAPWRGRGEALPAIRHVLTHFDWHLQPLRWDLPSRIASATRARIAATLGARWVSDGDALRMSLPAPVRQLLSAAA